MRRRLRRPKRLRAGIDDLGTPGRLSVYTARLKSPNSPSNDSPAALAMLAVHVRLLCTSFLEMPVPLASPSQQASSQPPPRQAIPPSAPDGSLTDGRSVLRTYS